MMTSPQFRKAKSLSRFREFFKWALVTCATLLLAASAFAQSMSKPDMLSLAKELRDAESKIERQETSIRNAYQPKLDQPGTPEQKKAIVVNRNSEIAKMKESELAAARPLKGRAMAVRKADANVNHSSDQYMELIHLAKYLEEKAKQ